MVRLVALLQPAQDRDRVGDGRLADHDRLEAPLEGGVLLDVLPILVERRRADAAELAAGEHRLQQVAGGDRSFGRAGADDRVQLVDEEDDPALGALDLRRGRPSAAPRTRRGTSSRRAGSRCRAPRRVGPSSLRERRRATIRCASPSTIAVLPTPGSPISTGLFFVRRESTWITRRISSSRPITGSSFPASASSVRSRAVLVRARRRCPRDPARSRAGRRALP